MAKRASAVGVGNGIAEQKSPLHVHSAIGPQEALSMSDSQAPLQQANRSTKVANVPAQKNQPKTETGVVTVPTIAPKRPIPTVPLPKVSTPVNIGNLSKKTDTPQVSSSNSSSATVKGTVPRIPVPVPKAAGNGSVQVEGLPRKVDSARTVPVKTKLPIPKILPPVTPTAEKAIQSPTTRSGEKQEVPVKVTSKSTTKATTPRIPLPDKSVSQKQQQSKDASIAAAAIKPSAKYNVTTPLPKLQQQPSLNSTTAAPKQSESQVVQPSNEIGPVVKISPRAAVISPPKRALRATTVDQRLKRTASTHSKVVPPERAPKRTKSKATEPSRPALKPTTGNLPHPPVRPPSPTIHRTRGQPVNNSAVGQVQVLASHSPAPATPPQRPPGSIMAAAPHPPTRRRTLIDFEDEPWTPPSVVKEITYFKSKRSKIRRQNSTVDPKFDKDSLTDTEPDKDTTADALAREESLEEGEIDERIASVPLKSGPSKSPKQPYPVAADIYRLLDFPEDRRRWGNKYNYMAEGIALKLKEEPRCPDSLKDFRWDIFCAGYRNEKEKHIREMKREAAKKARDDAKRQAAADRQAERPFYDTTPPPTGTAND